MLNKKFYYVQTAYVVNSKMLVVKQSNNVHGEEFLLIFKF